MTQTKVPFMIERSVPGGGWVHDIIQPDSAIGQLMADPINMTVTVRGIGGRVTVYRRPVEIRRAMIAEQVADQANAQADDWDRNEAQQ